MQDRDLADAERLRRIQRLVSQLTELISASAEQRRGLDRLLDEANALGERIAHALHKR